MALKIQIGDLIRDIEDSDCYFEGIVTSLNPIVYKITNIVWSREIDSSKNGEITFLKWWCIEVFKNSQWVKIN
jgi:hypothetical protein